MTKTELLATMKKWDACEEATLYVTRHPSQDASAILDECNRRDWLIWLLVRERRLTRFARVCVSRAKRRSTYWGEYAADADADAAAAYAAAAAYTYADAAAYADATAAYAAAAYTYADAAAYAVAERAKQLVGLRRIAREWAAGLPAEV